MTAPRRTALLLLAGLAAGPVPACIHISAPVCQAEPVAVRPASSGGFASLPSRPGEVIPTNPDAKAVAKPAPRETVDPTPTAQQSTSRRAEPKPEPSTPAPPEAPDALEAVVPIAAEPGQLPLLSGPPTPEPPLLAAVRAYVENRPDDAIRHLQSLDRPNQDFALTVLPLLVRGATLNMAEARPDDVAVLVDQFHGVASRLEPKAALRVEKVVFCRRVTGFGRYEPWPEAQPYRPNDLAVLYVEVRNVGCEPEGDGYVSRAAISLEVRDAHGRLVEQTDPADWRRRVPVARFDKPDHTRSPLRDYYRPYRISVPAQPGVYTVTVVVKDPVGNRTARSQPTEFRVAGP